MSAATQSLPALPIETPRLTLQRFTLDDAPFIHALTNDADFVRFIGDKGVRTLDDAREYLRTGPLASYARFGFGLYRVSLRRDGEPIGMCGLLKRDFLDCPDIGFAYLPRYRAQGYAHEAAAAVVAHARQHLGVTRLAGIAKPDNLHSIRLLTKLGLKLECKVRMNDGQEDNLYARDL